MQLFPLFVDLENENILIVGGGKVAFRKLERLTEFNISKRSGWLYSYFSKISIITFQRRHYVM